MREKQWTISDEISRETMTRPTKPMAMATLTLLMMEHGGSGDHAEFTCDDAGRSITIRRASTRKRGR